MTKCMVAIPALDGRCETALMISLLQLQHSQRVSLGFNVLNGGCYLSHVRNVLATRLLDTDFDSILFIDTDISFDSAAIERLILREEEIVGARVYYRTQKRRIMARLKEGASNESGLHEAHWIAGAVMRIKRGVFERLRKAVNVYDPIPGTGNEPEQIYNFFPAGIARTVQTEDVGFCRVASKAGYKIWVDMQCPCRHHGAIAFPLAETEEKIPAPA